MKHNSHPRIWPIVLVLFAIILSACERPIPGRDVTDETPTTTDEIPTTQPAQTLPETDSSDPNATEAYPAPTQDDAAGDTTSGDADSSEQPDEDASTDTPPDASSDTSAEEGGGAPESPQPPTEETSYTVQAGDTLFLISQRFGVSMQEIAAASNLTDINNLSVGQVITIPVPGTVSTTDDDTASTTETTHIVQSGDNLFRIGLRYGFTVEELASYNGITDPTRIDVGQVIRIPPSN